MEKIVTKIVEVEKKEDPKDYKVYKDEKKLLQGDLVKDLPEEEKPKKKYKSPWGNPGGRER